MPPGHNAQLLEAVIAEISDKVEIEIVFDEHLDAFDERLPRRPFGDINAGCTHSAMSKV